ncbi:MAG: cyclic nucleotide-binding domain-containing protein [Betaproteobacteria bacterium]|nr:cyclic nucleotide-binding domain-containing protein [Betaproteobacteria bacterium]
MLVLDGRFLAQAEALGDGRGFLAQIEALMGHDSIFSRISHEEAEYLAGMMQCYRAPTGTLLIKEGDASGFLLLLIEGRMEICKHRQDGSRALLAQIGPGCTLGEMSLFNAAPRSADCITLEPVTFATLTRGGMELLLRQDPVLANKILTQIILILSERLGAAANVLVETLRG